MDIRKKYKMYRYESGYVTDHLK